MVSEVSSQMTIKKMAVFMADEDSMNCHCLPCFSIVFVDKALTQDSLKKNILAKHKLHLISSKIACFCKSQIILKYFQV